MKRPLRSLLKKGSAKENYCALSSCSLPENDYDKIHAAVVQLQPVEAVRF